MRILMQKFTIRPGLTLIAGHYYDLPESLAAGLIENDRATEVFDEPPHTATVETAALNATDHSRKTTQRPRKR